VASVTPVTGETPGLVVIRTTLKSTKVCAEGIVRNTKRILNDVTTTIVVDALGFVSRKR
jgi:hypothetical protein